MEYKGSIDNEDDFIRAQETGGGYQLKTKKGGDYGYQAILQVFKNNKVIAQMERGSTSGYRHKSYTLTPDNRHIVSGGANGFLTLYKTQTGQKVHDFVGHTGDVWAVAVSPDGQRVVSGSHDQTIKIWNLQTGENLLTVFAGSDQEWVAWTKSGYYTSSPRGDQYIGWQVNKGADQDPEYYQAAQFSALLFRPEIVAATLVYASEVAGLAKTKSQGTYSIKQIAEFAPPKVTILKPDNNLSTSKEAITLEVQIESSKAPIKDIALYVNGRQVLTKDRRITDLRNQGRVQRYAVPLEVDLNNIKVQVTNVKNASSAAFLSIVRKAVGSSIKSQGDLYFFAVGVNHLDNIKSNDLDFPAKDAQDMAKLMQSLQGRLFKKVHTFIYSDLSANPPISSDIVDGLYQLHQAGQKDTVMIFLAGHGYTTEQNSFIFLTRNAKQYGNGTYYMSTVLRWANIFEVLHNINARRIVFLDTCYSGGVNISELIKRGSDSNLVILTSSKADQTSKESIKYQNGYFTHAIRKGLGPGLPADGYKDGEVNISELFSFVQGEVRKISHNTQTPVMFIPTGADGYPFFVKRR